MSARRCAQTSRLTTFERVVLDELAARLDDVAHQRGEDLVGLVGMVDPDLVEAADLMYADG